MNREIKFRAWDSTLKQFLPNIQNHLGNDEWAFGNILKENGNRFNVNQYTGLKDKNGKEIYEGDIIKYFNHRFRDPIIHEVEYHSEGTSFSIPNLHTMEDFEPEEGIEIIGNIYENPELLNS